MRLRQGPRTGGERRRAMHFQQEDSPMKIRIPVTCAVVLATCAVLLPGGVASAHSLHASRACRSIRAGGMTLAVTIDHGHVRCSQARRVLRTFMRGGGKYHGQPPAASEYWTI